jgi:drug/metabolite transporter (DMT)-like permease
MNSASSRKFDTTATFACIGMVACWTVGPIFIKFLTGHLDFWTQNMLRYLAACLFWLPFLLRSAKTKRLETKVWRKAVLPAAVNIAMQCFWASAFYYLSPAFMVLLIKSSIIWIAGFSFIFFVDERTLAKSKRFWLGLALSAIGVVGVMVCKEDFAAKKTITGIALALAASITWGMYTVFAKMAFKDIDSRSGFSVISIYTVAGLCMLALMFGKVSDCTRMAVWPWACVVISGVVSIALSHVLYYATMRRIGATIPSLVLLAQPFTVLAISAVVFGESLSGLQWLREKSLLTSNQLGGSAVFYTREVLAFFRLAKNK